MKVNYLYMTPALEGGPFWNHFSGLQRYDEIYPHSYSFSMTLDCHSGFMKIQCTVLYSYNDKTPFRNRLFSKFMISMASHTAVCSDLNSHLQKIRVLVPSLLFGLYDI